MTAMHEARAPARPQDKLGLWENSPELRDSVDMDLTEWGEALRGGMPELGYPRRAVFADRRGGGGATYRPEKVQAIEDTMTMWRLITREMEDYDRKASLLRLLMVLKTHYISNSPMEAKARRFNLSRRQFGRLLNDACYRFWVLHY